MLPDLWRMADRRVRPSRLVPPFATGALAEVLAGIEHHVAADRVFHTSSVFRDGERQTAEAFRAAALDAPRLPLFAHVAWELCLDGALLRREGFADVFAMMKRGLGAMTDDGADAEAATRHHFAPRARTAADREAFDGRMARILHELRRGPWIEGYQTGGGLAERLEQVRARLGFAPFHDVDRARLAVALDGRLDAAGAMIDAVGEP